MRLTAKERVLEFLNHLLLSIILPTLVTCSDLFIAYKMYSNSKEIWSLSLLAPVLLNFFFTSISWWKVEKTSAKRWSWLFLLFHAWPQLKAANLIRLISWKGNTKTGNLKKKEFYKSISPLQPLLQSTPEVILKSLLYGHLSRKSENTGLENLFGSWFLPLFATSLASVAVEMTRFLLNGPCRILPEDLSWRSIVTILCSFIPSVAIMTVKTRLLWVMIGQTEIEDTYRMTVIWAIFFILPNAVLAIVSIHSAVGVNSTFILKSTLQYFLLLLTPIMSIFVFGIFKSFGKIAFSSPLTLVNVLLTLLQCLVAAWLWPRSHHYDLPIGLLLVAFSVLAALLLLASLAFPDTWIREVVQVLLLALLTMLKMLTMLILLKMLTMLPPLPSLTIG